MKHFPSILHGFRPLKKGISNGYVRTMDKNHLAVILELKRDKYDYEQDVVFVLNLADAKMLIKRIQGCIDYKGGK